jgi:hypothetical protein
MEDDENTKAMMIGLYRRIEAHRWITKAVIAAVSERGGINVGDLIDDLEKTEKA